MKYRFFSVPASAPEESQEALNQFCGEVSIVSVERHFVPNGEFSYWFLCVCYFDGKGSPAVPGRKNPIDYREVLSEQDFAIYAKLRTLRKELSEKERVPAYTLFTNEQMAAMVQQRIVTRTALAEISGVGLQRVEKYGDAFIAVLRESHAICAGFPGTLRSISATTSTKSTMRCCTACCNGASRGRIFSRCCGGSLRAIR